jgi:Pro-kumamolisin, activation domain
MIYGRGIFSIGLLIVLGGCSSPAPTPNPGGPAQGPTDAGTTNTKGDATSPTGPSGDAGSGGDDASVDEDVCSPPVATPQVFAGEVASVDQTCGALDGGAPPLVGPVDPTTTIEFDLGLPDRNQSELNELLNEISDPSSPEYRQYLTPDEFTAMFGPTVCDYDAVVAWAKAQGFTVAMTYSDRSLVDLTAPASTVNAAFHVTLNEYQRRDGTMFYAPDVDPSADLTVPVLGPEGLDNCAVAMPATAGKSP